MRPMGLFWHQFTAEYRNYNKGDSKRDWGYKRYRNHPKNNFSFMIKWANVFFFSPKSISIKFHFEKLNDFTLQKCLGWKMFFHRNTFMTVIYIYPSSIQNERESNIFAPLLNLKQTKSAIHPLGRLSLFCHAFNDLT